MQYVCIDADYMVYSAGFATESVEYIVSAKLAAGGDVEDVVDSAEAARAWQEGRDWPLGTKFRTPVRQVEAEPVSHAKLIIRNIIKKIKTRAASHFGDEPKTVMYLTGKANFRDGLATIKPYKGNRNALHKPVHYRALRDYLVSLGAIEVHGYEADDACAMLMAKLDYDENRVLLAAVDKDLWTVPGLHYNFMKDEWSSVTEQDALVTFYRQLITGDTVDNIMGCYRRGPSFAASVTHSMTEQEMYDICLDAYRDSQKRAGCPYAHLDADFVLLENARLLHMMRGLSDWWVPPGQRPAQVSSEQSCATSTSVESTTSTSPAPSASPSPSLGSSVKSAAKRSRAKRGTRQTSRSPGTKSGSKRKASLPQTTKGA
jgi:hypothetical protein